MPGFSQTVNPSISFNLQSKEAQKQTVQQLLQNLKDNPGPAQELQLLNLLKNSPVLMSAFIKQRQENVTQMIFF